MDLKILLNDSIERWHKRSHYDYQQQIAFAILDAVVKSQRGETVELAMQLPRQCGKTTTVVDATEFLLVAARRYFRRPLSIGVFAPQIEQATTDFDRLKLQFSELAPLGLRTRAKIDGDLKIPEKWNSKTIRIFNKSSAYLGEVYIFPVTKTSKIESKTMDLILIEEAQDMDDQRMMDAVFPMGASTNAPRIYIGTAGTRVCYYKKLIDKPGSLKIGIEEVLAQRRAKAKETGDNRHLLYEAFYNHEVAFHGKDSDYIRRQYGGEWIIGTGQFATAEQLEKMVVTGRPIVSENKTELPIFVGIDTAKHVDRTVVTVVRDHSSEGKKNQLLGWLSLHGDNYEDQFDYIIDYLKQFENIRLIAIDATGQGDFMPDKFERHTSYNILRVKFSAESKDVIFKILLQVIQNTLTELPDAQENEDLRRFWQEILDMQKEYKGRFLSCHHPEAPGAHDDYPDSWALAEFALTEAKKNEPSISFL